MKEESTALNASWSVARLLREFPECKPVVQGWEMKSDELGAMTLETIAEELEEDLEDFIDELDRHINSSSSYEADTDDFDEDDVLGSLTQEDDDSAPVEGEGEELEEDLEEIEDVEADAEDAAFVGEMDGEFGDDEEEADDEEEEEVEEAD